MKLDEAKEMALQHCCDIATDYSEDEVNRFAPKSVQLAWKLGNDHLKQLIKESKKARKGMVI